MRQRGRTSQPRGKSKLRVGTRNGAVRSAPAALDRVQAITYKARFAGTMIETPSLATCQGPR
jgi:hypothetical protein